MPFHHPEQRGAPDGRRADEAHAEPKFALMHPGRRANRGQRYEYWRRHALAMPQVERRRRIHRSRQAECRVLRREPLVHPGLHAIWLWMLQGKFPVVDQTPALASVAPAEQRTQGAALPRLRLGLEQARFVGEAVERKRAKVLA